MISRLAHQLLRPGVVEWDRTPPRDILGAISRGHTCNDGRGDLLVSSQWTADAVSRPPTSSYGLMWAVEARIMDRPAWRAVRVTRRKIHRPPTDMVRVASLGATPGGTHWHLDIGLVENLSTAPVYS